MQRSKLTTLSEADLFILLQSLGLPLESSQFVGLARKFETPEELAEHLTNHFQQERSPKIYFTLFELWRRLLPEKRSLSLFCAELDHKISLQGVDLAEDLEVLASILQGSVDEGMPPQKAFKALQLYFENDLESTLYDLIILLIDSHQNDEALDLIETFIPYVQEPLWFDFLHARALCQESREEGFLEMERIIELCKKGKNLELNLEILDYLAEHGHSLFLALAEKTPPLIYEKEDMADFLNLLATHFKRISCLPLVQQIEKMQQQNHQEGPKALCFNALFSG